VSVDENVEKIISKITESAKAQADEIMAEGKNKAGKIIEDAKVRASDIRKNIKNEGKRKAEQEKKRIIADGTIKAKRKKLDAKEEVISKAFEMARAELDKVDKDKYEAFLVDIAKESCIDIGGGNIEILLRPEDKGILEPELGGISKEVSGATGKETSISISNDTIDEPGLVVRTDNGRVEVSNTFKSRMERMRSELRTEVAKVLFG
jgi:V/A-type H+-transporting ATPase subunit E